MAALASAVYLPDKGIDEIGQFPNLLIKQSRKGCLRNMCGCDATTEAHVATKEDKNINRFYILETSSCFFRTFCESIHPFKMDFSIGGDKGGPIISQFERPMACPVSHCKCCCFQEISVLDNHSKAVVGKTTETFWLCGPQFNVTNQAGEQEYKIHIPICCFCLPNICKEGLCSCRVPFYIYLPGASAEDQHVGSIVKIWSGFGNEVLGAHQFQVDFPEKASPNTKMTLMGSAMLINELFFKGNGKN